MKRSEAVAIRKALDNFVTKITDNPTEINANIAAIRLWTPGMYAIDDVRIYDDIPYKCVQTHDSTGNTTWNPVDTPSLWMQYHGTNVDTARPWIAPTGTHDMYKTGEYMIWTDDQIYRCLADTVYSPTDYPAAWEINT